MGKYRIIVDEELRDIVPGYLASRNRELPELLAFYAARDFESLRKVGHKLSGSGGGYGFVQLTELGKRIEALALAGDAAGIAPCLAELKDYLENLEVVYE